MENDTIMPTRLPESCPLTHQACQSESGARPSKAVVSALPAALARSPVLLSHATLMPRPPHTPPPGSPASPKPPPHASMLSSVDLFHGRSEAIMSIVSVSPFANLASSSVKELVRWRIKLAWWLLGETSSRALLKEGDGVVLPDRRPSGDEMAPRPCGEILTPPGSYGPTPIPAPPLSISFGARPMRKESRSLRNDRGVGAEQSARSVLGGCERKVRARHGAGRPRAGIMRGHCEMGRCAVRESNAQRLRAKLV